MGLLPEKMRVAVQLLPYSSCPLAACRLLEEVLLAEVLLRPLVAFEEHNQTQKLEALLGGMGHSSEAGEADGQDEQGDGRTSGEAVASVV